MTESYRPPFLLIPRELRDRIYIYVLRDSNQTPPRSPKHAGARTTDRKDFYCSWVAYEPRKLPRIVPSLGLLGCCHQTRSEIHETITEEDANERKPPLYILDCMIERHKVLPTWISLPHSLAHVHRLELNIRVFYSNYDTLLQRHLIPFPRIYDLLYRLLNYGPRFHHSGDGGEDVFINTLVLNLIDKSAKREFPESPVSMERVWRCVDGLERYGLLRGRVGMVRVGFGEEAVEVRITGGEMKVRKARCSQWVAWRFRWPKDEMAHRSDT